MFRTEARHAVDAALSEVYAAQRHACFDFDELEEEISYRDVEPVEIPRLHVRGERLEDLKEDRASGSVTLLGNGDCSEAAEQLLGRYVPLCKRSTGSREFVLRLSPSFVVAGHRTRRVYASPFAIPPLRREKDADQCQIRPILAQDDDGQWFVVDAGTAEWLARAPALGGRWVVRTGVAHETELGLRAALGDQHVTAVSLPRSLPCLLQDADDLPMRLQARVIALPERAHCVAAIAQQLEGALGKDGQYRLRVDLKHSAAWDTRGIDPGMLRSAGFVEGPRVKDSANILGCALSHSEIWAELIEASGDSAEMMLILEDDAVINTARPVEKLLLRLLAEAPKYDFVALGASMDESWNAACKANSPPEWLCDDLVRLKFFAGFWGYIITRQGAKRALTALWGTATSPRPLTGDCDILIATEASEGRLDAAMCVPNLVLHPSWGRVRQTCIDYEYIVHCERGATAKLGLGGRAAAIGAAAQSARMASVSTRAAKRRSPVDDIKALVNRCRSVTDETQKIWNDRILGQLYVGRRPCGFLA